jgi:hypothetical protein
MDPNAGGFGQEESEIVTTTFLVILLSVSFSMTQISLVLKKNNLKSSSCRIKFKC